MKHIAKLLVAIFLLFQLTNQVFAQLPKYDLPNYYMKGSVRVAVSRMISNICPRIVVKENLVDKYLDTLSVKLEEDKVLPKGVQEFSYLFKFNLVTDDRFVDMARAIFQKYKLDPFKKLDASKSEVFERYCAMGEDEIRIQSSVGKFLKLKNK